MTQIIDISQANDRLLIEKYRQKQDKNLVGELFKRYTGFVFLISMKYLKDEDKSKDAVMQIFEKLFDDLLLHEIDNFKAWLHTVTRNHCLGVLRKEQSKQKHQARIKENTVFMENLQEEHPINESKPENSFENLEKALEKLKPEQKKCIQLFYLDEKSYKEIVAITGFSDKKVKSYIQNGKRNLKIILQKMSAGGLILIVLWQNINN
ncbi:MAG: sigma-70 family RNA polymerase sigma factor [Bacteroidales bacterium]|nr:sigma-70 family RNA polymerase sigma factor [Bacteroidales bacterium]